MEQQRQKQIRRKQSRAAKYKRQRDIVIMASLIGFCIFFIIFDSLLNTAQSDFDDMCDLVDTYRTQNQEYFDELMDLREQVELLEYKNNELQEKIDAKPAYFTPTDWIVSDNSTAKIYESIPLSPELQQYTWDLCKYLDIEDYYETALAIMWQESEFTPDIVSGTNDYGIMQINKCNIESLTKTLGITDIMEPDQNICCGIYMLASLAHSYDEIHSILMAYNMGSGGMEEAHAKGIYSTAYSRSVVKKTQMILQDKYDPNLT